jgi:flagellar hook assembly protein FlgD
MRNETAFAYSVDRVSPVRVSVFDVVGRRVRTLVEGVSSAGVNRVTWDARDDAGRPVGSGVYFVRFASDGGTRRSD